MKNNKKLFLAWIIFLTIAFFFIIAVEVYHNFQSERMSNYQYRILISKDSIIEIDPPNPSVSSPEEKKVDPDAKFYEQTKYGNLPKIASKGACVFDEYSAYSEISAKKELRVAILIGDGKANLNLKLNGQRVTFILPHYIDQLESVAKAIRKSGNEFFIQIPTQSSIPANKKESVSPFLANANLNDTLEKLFYLIGSTKYALGIASVSPTLLTKSKKDITAIADALSQRGLAFLDVEKSNDLLKGISEKNGLIYINATNKFEANDFDISKLKDRDVIIIRLEQLESLMKILPSDWILTPVSASVRR
ncbi:MAG: divergent polysaccharide deacetylase family protein [Holosporaceae bacterium]|jgi:polysaccharide deacetylase 2 family uncharacterized protein YibQ|nr:divergent polysaccharide deacetylase family protein [Holosporaceae bacterium]